jgi:hypothetical protein
MYLSTGFHQHFAPLLSTIADHRKPGAALPHSNTPRTFLSHPDTPRAICHHITTLRAPLLNKSPNKKEKTLKSSYENPLSFSSENSYDIYGFSRRKTI